MKGWLCNIFGLGAAAIAAAMPVMPQQIPGDRLIKNLEDRLAKKPKEAPQIYYLIGRAHYATYAMSYEGNYIKPGEVQYLPSYEKEGLPGFPGYMGLESPWNGSFVPKATPDNIRHIRGAVKNLLKAIEMNHDDSVALPHLTLACVFESAAPLAKDVPLRDPLLTTTDQFRAAAAKEYLSAYKFSIRHEEKEKTIPLFGLRTLISYEAARSYLRVDPKGVARTEMQAAVAKFDKLPPSGIVTPLIFDVDAPRSLSELLAPTKQVDFDLNGTGLPQRYSWVQPTTGFLVWDPEGGGDIHTGRRLFGSATWWMLWSNAYDAMQALDDDHDGWLTGSELKGLAVWFDRNQNGRSDPGEVVSLSSLGIESIATHTTGSVGLTPMNANGLKMKDGRLLPTYDWVTKPAKTSS